MYVCFVYEVLHVILRKKAIKKSPPHSQIGTKTHKQIILRGTTRIPGIFRALNKAYNGAARLCLIPLVSAKPLTGELQKNLPQESFQPMAFPLFSEKVIFTLPVNAFININNNRDNNIIKSNFQAFFRLKIACKVI